MSFAISSLNNISFKANPQQNTVQKQVNSNKTNQNPISRKGETANLVKATFLGGLALGGRLL